MSKLMKQTYLKWYQFNVNIAHILLATCTYKKKVVVSTNESDYIVKFQYY